MSGGHFTDCGYDYHKVRQFGDELADEIQRNGKVGEEGEWYPNHSDEVIEYLKKQVRKMRKMSEIMRHIDYLYSADHGDDSFMDLVKEVDNKYYEYNGIKEYLKKAKKNWEESNE